MNLLYFILPFPQIFISKPWIRNEIPRTKLNPLSDLGRASLEFFINEFQKLKSQKSATSGNRTRASRVAGENSTTEPTLLRIIPFLSHIYFHLSVTNSFYVLTITKMKNSTITLFIMFSDVYKTHLTFVVSRSAGGLPRGRSIRPEIPMIHPQP